MKSTGQPTINDVARIAGVSRKTVSRVANRPPLLNDDTRKRVEEVIGGMGYIPNPQARALALRRNFLIGLVHDNPNAQMVMNVQHGIPEALHGTEFELVVQPLDRGSPTMLADLRHVLERQRLFGIVLLPPIGENDTIPQLCTEIGCRYVRMGSAPLDDDNHMVASNDCEAVRAATDYLIQQPSPDRADRRAARLPLGARAAARLRAGARRRRDRAAALDARGGAVAVPLDADPARIGRGAEPLRLDLRRTLTPVADAAWRNGGDDDGRGG